MPVPVRDQSVPGILSQLHTKNACCFYDALQHRPWLPIDSTCELLNLCLLVLNDAHSWPGLGQLMGVMMIITCTNYLLLTVCIFVLFSFPCSCYKIPTSNL